MKEVVHGCRVFIGMVLVIAEASAIFAAKPEGYVFLLSRRVVRNRPTENRG